jgi:hypothetical protein
MRRSLVALSAVALLTALVPVAGASATAAARPAQRPAGDIRELPTDYKLPRVTKDPAAAAQASRIFDAQRATEVGDEKIWLAIDDEEQSLYTKDYTFRGKGDHIEVWVASDSDEVSAGTDFPDGDCRNDERTEITDDQVNYLIDEFDTNIYPKESATFSVPPNRDGRRAPLAKMLELPGGYYSGAGDKIVVLIDNVRDANFYDTDNANGLSYIAGFFSSGFNFYLNRNVMTIDAYDWLHRTGPNPPNEPVAGDLCASAPARPYLYEGVFAHEYQHLLESYEDPFEGNWINEGISDWAQTLTGYVDAAAPVTEIGFDNHVQCFLGWAGILTPANPNPRPGGPENSLNLWGDQTDYEAEILCDYGATYSMMLTLADRYGPDFMGDFHRDDLQGFESLQSLLDTYDPGMTVAKTVNDWAAVVALDGILDDGARFTGYGDHRRSDYRVGTLDATINWATDQTYSSPGAPPNGSDFVRLRDGETWIRARNLDSLKFKGDTLLPSLPVEWTVDAAPPGDPDDAALYSGKGDNLDRAIVREVTVPEGDPTLTFEGAWDTEIDYDYAYVQVSTDGGQSYESIECTDTAPAPLGSGFNGDSAGFQTETCDLSAYAGDTIVLSFRYVSDSSVQEDGFWVDDVTVGGDLVSDGSSLDGWQSLTEYRQVDVEDFTVQIVSYTADHSVAQLANVQLSDGFGSGLLRGRALDRKVADGANTVSVIVTYHDSTETVGQYAPYALRANGVLQPGGAADV